MKTSFFSNLKTKFNALLAILVILLSCIAVKPTYADTLNTPTRIIAAGDNIYFYNNVANWNEVRLYAFNSISNTGCTSWNDRYTMQKLDNDGDMYKYTMPSGIDACQADSVVFSDNSGHQTADLHFAGTNYAYVVNGTGRSDGFWYEMQNVRIMRPGDVIYFDNSGLTASGWSTVKIHLFSGLPGGSDATTWGNLPEMTRIDGTNIYKFTVTESYNTIQHKVNKMVFTNGGRGNDTQTIDLGFIESDLVYKVNSWENHKGLGYWYVYNKTQLRDIIDEANEYINKLRCVPSSEYASLSQAIQRGEAMLVDGAEVTIETDPTATSGDYWDKVDIEAGSIENKLDLLKTVYGEVPTICTFTPTITKTIIDPQTEYMYGDVVRFKIDVTNVPAQNNGFAITINLQENLAGAEFEAGEGYTVSAQGNEATATIAANQTLSFYASYEITDDETALRTNTVAIASAVPADNRYDLSPGTHMASVDFSTKSWDDIPVPTGIENNSGTFLILIIASSGIVVLNIMVNRRKRH